MQHYLLYHHVILLKEENYVSEKTLFKYLRLQTLQVFQFNGPKLSSRLHYKKIKVALGTKKTFKGVKLLTNPCPRL